MPKEPESKTNTMPATVDPKGVPPAISDEIVDQLLAGYKKPEDLLGPGGLIKQLMGRLITRAMNAEMSHHLGYEAGQSKPQGASNHRNGTSAKTVLTDSGSVRIEVPWEREGSCEPQLIGKHERRLTGFDDKLIAMYARGMTVREIQGFMAEMYAVDVSQDLISSVTDDGLGEVATWQARPLEAMYPVVFFDALRVKIR